jgi:hypothetical protein
VKASERAIAASLRQRLGWSLSLGWILILAWSLSLARSLSREPRWIAAAASEGCRAVEPPPLLITGLKVDQ